MNSTINLPYFQGLSSITDDVLFTLSELVDVNFLDGWTDISNNVFMNKVGLLNIGIPYTVTNIGTAAFKNAIELSGVNFNYTDEQPSQLTTIGDEAFKNTFKLTQLNIPSSVTTIGTNVFQWSGLTSIIFTSNSAISNLSAATFKGATALNDISFQSVNNNYSTSNGALYDFSMSKLILYYSKDTSITTFMVPASVVSIEDGAFQYSSHLTAITFETSDENSNLTTIGTNAFRGLALITSFVIPRSVTTIGANALQEMSSLGFFTIPTSVTTIGEDAFRNLSSLHTFSVSTVNPNFSSVDRVLFNKDKTILIQYPIGYLRVREESSYTIPNTVQTIKERALEYAKINQFLVEDGSSSFVTDSFGVLYNSTYTSLIQYPLYSTTMMYQIDYRVLTVYVGAFNDANSLTTLDIPYSVRNIQQVEFVNMTELLEFGLNKSGDSPYTFVAFDNPASPVTNQLSIIISIRDGVLYGGNMRTIIKYPCKKDNTIYYLFDSVSVINAGAFSNAINLTEVNSNLVNTIQPYAFKNCTGLTRVQINRSTRYIGNNAFDGAFSTENPDCILVITTDEQLTIGEDAFKNSNVNFVTYERSYNLDPELHRPLPDVERFFNRSFYGKASVGIQIVAKYFTPYSINTQTSVLWPSTKLLLNSPIIYIGGYNTIGRSAFENADRIIGVNFIDKTLRRIQHNAFKDCTGLQSFIIPNRVTKIRNNAFEGTTSMTNITMHDKITDISDEAFKNSGIVAILFPTSLLNIGSNAFNGCIGLQNITIPPSVTAIGSNAFVNCSNLDTVTFDETTNLDLFELPISISSNEEDRHEFFGASLVEIKAQSHLFILTRSGVNNSRINVPFTSRNTPTLLLRNDNNIGGIRNRTDISGNYTNIVIDFQQNPTDFLYQPGTYTLTEINDDGELYYLNAYNFYEHEYDRARGLYIFPSYFPNLQTIIFNDTTVFDNPYGTSSARRLPDGINAGNQVKSNLFAENHNSDDTTVVNYDTNTIYIENRIDGLSTLNTMSSNTRYKNTLARNLILFDSNISDNIFIPPAVNLPINIIMNNIRKIEVSHYGNNSSVSELNKLFPNAEEIIFTSIRELGRNCIGPIQTTITLPRNVEIISSEFAVNANNLTSVTFESSFTVNYLNLTAGLTRPFFGAPYPVDIYVTTHEFNKNIDDDTHNNNGELINGGIYFSGENNTSINATILNYTSIGVNSFAYSFKLMSVELDNILTVIKSGAFKNTGISSITIPPNVVSIGDEAFSYSLGWNSFGSEPISITFSEFSILETIGDNVFENTKLPTITIPYSVSHIGEEAFKNNTMLTSVIFATGSNLTTISKRMFQFCSGLTSIVIPAQVTSIDESAFHGCSNLQSVTFASGSRIETIGQEAFYECSALTNISFPTTITNIGIRAFSRSGLTSLFFPIEMECRIDENAFAYLINALTNVTFQPLISDISMNSASIFHETTINEISMTSYDRGEFELTVNDGKITNFFGGVGDCSYVDTTPSNTPICFPAGTPVRTNLGDVAIDKLDPDTHTIRNKRIVAITQSQPLHTYIVNIEKNALAKNVPCQNTQISKEHKLYYKGEMIKAKELVNLCKGVTKIPYTGEILYNVLMEQHDKMMINNLICETLHPENIMAKIHNGNYNTQEKMKLYKKVSSLITTGNMLEYNKLYQSI